MARPALLGLIPQAQALGPALRASERLFRQTTAPIRDQIRPFTRQVRPVLVHAKQGSPDLDTTVNEFGTSLGALNGFLNELAYKPKGSRQSFLFYLPWLNHDINASFNLADAGGPIARGLVMISCNGSYIANGIVPLKPYLQTDLPGRADPRARRNPTRRQPDRPLRIQATMSKRAPSTAQLLVIAGFALSCFGILLFLWITFGGPTPFKARPYEIKIPFNEAAQLAEQSDVRISGVSVGKVQSDRRGAERQAGAGDDRHRGQVRADPAGHPRHPPHQDAARRDLRRADARRLEWRRCCTTARPWRWRTWPNRFSSTRSSAPSTPAPAPPSRNGWGKPRWRSGAAARASPMRLPSSTRPSPNSTASSGCWTPSGSPSSQLFRNGAVTFRALRGREGQLADLIRSSNAVFQTTAARERDLEALFRAFPTFEDESRLTLDRLREFAVNTDPLMRQLVPAAEQLSPTLIAVSRLAPQAKGFFEGLEPVIDRAPTGFPALRKLFRDEFPPLLRAVNPFLRNLNPILTGLDLYKRDIAGTLGNVAAATNAVHLSSAGTADPLPAAARPVRPRIAGDLSGPPHRQPQQRLQPAGLRGAPRQGAAQLPHWPVQRRDRRHARPRHAERIRTSTNAPGATSPKRPPSSNG